MWFEYVDDLISRQSAIEEIEFGITNLKIINKETGEVTEPFAKLNDELREAVERVKKLPSAQRKGNWIGHKDYPDLAYLCSECGYFTTMPKYHYCPNCGARME